MAIDLPALLQAAALLLAGGGVVYLVMRYQNAQAKAAKDAASAKHENDRKMAELRVEIDRLKAAKRTPEERHVSLQRAGEDIVRLQVMAVTDGLDVLGRLSPEAYREIVDKFGMQTRGERK